MLSADGRAFDGVRENHPLAAHTEPTTHPFLALSGEAYARVDTFIKTLLDETGIRYAILIDHKGFILSHCESPWAPRPPEMAGIATLVASNFAATGTLADLPVEGEFTE